MPKNSGRGSRPRKRSYAKPPGSLTLPPHAASRGGLKYMLPTGALFYDLAEHTVEWEVHPTERLRGRVGENVTWEAEWVRTVTPRGGIQFATYDCTVTVLERTKLGLRSTVQREALYFGPYRVLHRPDEGDLVLAAKVLAMVAVQPGWHEYKDRVTEGW